MRVHASTDGEETIPALIERLQVSGLKCVLLPPVGPAPVSPEDGLDIREIVQEGQGCILVEGDGEGVASETVT
jgi:hypothetical protein